MKKYTFILLVLASIVIFSCHHNTKDVIVDSHIALRIGAVYISCDSPPWKFNMNGLLGCEKATPTILELNPENVCAFESIVDQNGSISISFSNNSQLGRIHIVKLRDDLELRNQNSESVSELYINETDHFFIEQNGVEIKVTVKNAYVGGCFHELIQWVEIS